MGRNVDALKAKHEKNRSGELAMNTLSGWVEGVTAAVSLGTSLLFDLAASTVELGGLAATGSFRDADSKALVKDLERDKFMKQALDDDAEYKRLKDEAAKAAKFASDWQKSGVFGDIVGMFTKIWGSYDPKKDAMKKADLADAAVADRVEEIQSNLNDAYSKIEGTDRL